MRMYDIIQRKKAREELTEEEIRFLIAGYTAGDIPDYQMSAFAMAVYFNGMTPAETAILTDAMMHSGDTVDLSCFGTLSVDKHSTGGVGDKTSLIVAPIVSALGGKLAKMSGRGLGHTGGIHPRFSHRAVRRGVYGAGGGSGRSGHRSVRRPRPCGQEVVRPA